MLYIPYAPSMDYVPAYIMNLKPHVGVHIAVPFVHLGIEKTGIGRPFISRTNLQFWGEF